MPAGTRWSSTSGSDLSVEPTVKQSNSQTSATPLPCRHKVVEHIRRERAILDSLAYPGIAQLFFTFQARTGGGWAAGRRRPFVIKEPAFCLPCASLHGPRPHSPAAPSRCNMRLWRAPLRWLLGAAATCWWSSSLPSSFSPLPTRALCCAAGRHLALPGPRVLPKRWGCTACGFGLPSHTCACAHAGLGRGAAGAAGAAALASSIAPLFPLLMLILLRFNLSSFFPQASCTTRSGCGGGWTRARPASTPPRWCSCWSTCGRTPWWAVWGWVRLGWPAGCGARVVGGARFVCRVAWAGRVGTHLAAASLAKS